jgi:O-antigen/teichoic acid export membrane protein
MESTRDQTNRRAVGERTSPDVSATQANGVTSAPALAGAVVRGSIWMILTAVSTRVASLVATIVLGRMLDDHQWGLYGLAISTATILGSVRDGGARNLLMQRPREYESLVGPVFWLSMAGSMACAVVLGIGAPLVAWAVGEPELTRLMLVLAVSFPLGMPGQIYQATLSVRLQFGGVGLIQTLGGFLRFGLAIALAAAGFGALAFVLPVIPVALLEWALGWRFARERLWTRPAEVRRWGWMLVATMWIVLGTVGNTALNWGANLSIKPFVSTEVVGAFFFAFQIVAQVNILLSANFGAVLFPALARIVDEPRRLAAGVLRSARQVMLLAAPLSVGLAVTFPSLEAVLFGGAKRGSIDAVMIQGATYAFAVLMAVPLAVQQARGAFRAWAIGWLSRSALCLLAAAAGAVVHGTPAGIAAWSGVAGGAVALSFTVRTMREIGISGRAIAMATLPAYLISLVCGAAAWYLDAALEQSGMSPVVRFLLVGGVFTVLFAAGVRASIPGHLREMLAVMPARIGPFAQRLLLLRERAA